MIRLYEGMGTKWNSFIEEVKKSADPEDQNQIDMVKLK